MTRAPKTASVRARPGAVTLRRTLPLHIMLLPGVLLLFIFSYLPMGGIVIAFQRFKPALGFFGKQRWVGLENFAFVLSLPNTLGVLRNTLVMAASKIALTTFASITVSLLLNEIRRRSFKRAVQTIIYFPHFLSWVILSGVFVDLLSPSAGLVNRALAALGIKPVFFLGDQNWFPVTMILTDVWKGFGFGTVIYMSAISSIDQALYEAAAIDGAGRGQQAFHITLANLRQTIILLTVLNLGNILNAGFDQIYNLYNASVFETGDILDTLVYRMGIGSAQYSPATAVGLFKSVVSVILIGSAYYIAYKRFDYTIF